MQRFITDERTGIRYELIGDYYYPCLTVEESPPLSKYGRLRQRYLREHKRVLYFNLMTSGRLYGGVSDEGNGTQARSNGGTESNGYDEMGRNDE